MKKYAIIAKTTTYAGTAPRRYLATDKTYDSRKQAKAAISELDSVVYYEGHGECGRPTYRVVCADSKLATDLSLCHCR